MYVMYIVYMYTQMWRESEREGKQQIKMDLESSFCNDKVRSSILYIICIYIYIPSLPSYSMLQHELRMMAYFCWASIVPTGSFTLERAEPPFSDLLQVIYNIFQIVHTSKKVYQVPSGTKGQPFLCPQKCQPKTALNSFEEIIPSASASTNFAKAVRLSWSVGVFISRQ